MKKKFVIILMVQTVLVGLFFIYAFIQKLEADKQRNFVLEERDRAVEHQKKYDEVRNKMEEEMAGLREKLKNCN